MALQIFPRRFNWQWWEGAIVSGSQFESFDAGAGFPTYTAQRPAADGDSILFEDILLQAGDYCLNIVGFQTNNSGIAEIRIDGVLDSPEGTFDWYSGGGSSPESPEPPVSNVIHQIYFTNPASGYVDVLHTINGKNPASTDFEFWSQISFIIPAPGSPFA